MQPAPSALAAARGLTAHLDVWHQNMTGVVPAARILTQWSAASPLWSACGLDHADLTLRDGLAWGPELTFFCNDAYLPTVGIKRDWVLGSRSEGVAGILAGYRSAHRY